MTAGTAVLILGVLYMIFLSRQFRMVSLGIASVAGGALAWAMVYSADKPQTIFYSHKEHPAFLMKAGDVCPGDRHVWNGWCVK